MHPLDSTTNLASTPSLAETLDRLKAMARIPSGGYLGTAINPAEELRGLLQEVTRLERGSNPYKAPPRSVIDGAIRKWRTSEGQFSTLTAREVRALCGEPSIAMSERFVHQLSAIPDLSCKRQWLERLTESYFAEWGRIANQSVIERTLQRAVREFTGRSERLKRYWSGAESLFSARAPEWLGAEVVRAGKSAPDHLASLGIDPGSRLGEAAANATVDAWAREIEQSRSSQRGRTSARERLTQLTTRILVPQTLDRPRLGRAVSALILHGSDGLTDELRKELGAYLLAEPRFGDPRLPARRTNWDTVEKPALERFIGWLARNDLLFFFQFVISHDDQGRKEFWLDYIDQVEDSNVALGEMDAKRLESQVTASERQRVSSYSRLTGDLYASVFLMKFRDGTVVVEYSKRGHAMYVYDEKDFNRIAGGIRKPRVSDGNLKDRSQAERIVHRLGWEVTARQVLARRGIRPH